MANIWTWSFQDISVEATELIYIKAEIIVVLKLV